MALTVCTVSGFLYDPEGNTLNSTEVTFRQSEWLAGTDGIVEPRTVTTTTSGTGLISLDLTPGIYWCYTSTQLKNFSISVPDAASADIEVIADFSGNSKKAEFIDGIETAPSIKFASDTDTGLYLSAANQIGFTTGGTKRAHVDSTEFQIDVPVTGTAVQSSTTDTTAGKLLTTGAFGLGEDAGPLLTDLDSHTASGFYYSLGGDHVNAPLGANPFPDLNGAFALWSGSALIGTEDQYLTQTAYNFSSSEPIMLIRNKATTWSAWKNVTPQSFGIGGKAATLTTDDSFDDPALASGFYFVESGATGTRPAGLSLGHLMHRYRLVGDRAVQVFTADGGNSYSRVYVSAAWTDWQRVYNTSNILGTVSQTAGVPTGAVIERGSNGFGEYVRFADGTQICTNDNAAITTNPATFVGTVTSIDGDKLRLGYWF